MSTGWSKRAGMPYIHPYRYTYVYKIAKIVMEAVVDANIFFVQQKYEDLSKLPVPGTSGMEYALVWCFSHLYIGPPNCSIHKTLILPSDIPTEIHCIFTTLSLHCWFIPDMHMILGNNWSVRKLSFATTIIYPVAKKNISAHFSNHFYDTKKLKLPISFRCNTSKVVKVRIFAITIIFIL